MRPTTIAAASLVAVLLSGTAPAQEAKKIQVLTTTTELREIARAVGGDAVEVRSLAKGPEDPHFIDARPSFVRMAHDADLFVKTGMELEIGYEGPIVRDARNPRIQPGTPGFCDASEDVDKLEVPTGTLDRSMGDVHAAGNPHYLVDPVRAKTVAATIAGSLSRVDPAGAAGFQARSEEFAKRIDAALFGEKLLARAPAKRLERLLAEGRLAAYLKEKGWEQDLGGWAEELVPFAGAKVVEYHELFTYLADRFHFEEVARLEPKPGIAPTARHVQEVMEVIRKNRIRALLVAVFQPKDVPQSVERETGAKVVTLAHMPGAVAGTDDYLAMVDYNVRSLAAALGGK